MVQGGDDGFYFGLKRGIFMITIDKSIIITISQDDANTFSDVCEAARIYLRQNKSSHGDNRRSGIFDPEQFYKMEKFLDNNFS